MGPLVFIKLFHKTSIRSVILIWLVMNYTLGCHTTSSGFIKSKAANKVRISAASLECVGHLDDFHLFCNTHLLRMSRNKLGLIIAL